MAGRAYGYMMQNDFLQGVSPRSAALLVRGRVLGGMRLPGEPVRHRILDLIGDLALAGHPVEGRITAFHTGHELNHALVAALMRDTTAWVLA
jgi:UDP-3-O-[3-hydroxymyristoyl] N-acetylglucosamine deacetylase